MTRDEFIELHGEELWKLLVEPLQKYGEFNYQRDNANIIVHNDVLMPLMERMGPEARGMKDLL
jgi:hypothetical protein